MPKKSLVFEFFVILGKGMQRQHRIALRFPGSRDVILPFGVCSKRNKRTFKPKGAIRIFAEMRLVFGLADVWNEFGGEAYRRSCHKPVLC
jgi:hypothetical protein